MTNKTRSTIETLSNQLSSISAQITCIMAGLSSHSAPTPETLENALDGIAQQITGISAQLDALQKEEATE